MGCTSSKQFEEPTVSQSRPAASDTASALSPAEASRGPNAALGTQELPLVSRPAAVSQLSGEPSGLDLKEATEKPLIIFVIGGPGSGKGTQCKKILEKYGGGLRHLSTGDLLRAEVQKDTSLGRNLKAVVQSGALASDEQVIELLEKEINESAWFGLAFLVDGFPRALPQAKKFEERIRPSDMVLYFACSEPVMTQRLLDRGKTSVRGDDNPKTVKERLKIFRKETMPVVDYFQSEGKLYSISAEHPVDEVFTEVTTLLDARLGDSPKVPPEAKAEASGWRLPEVIDIENRFYGSLKQ